MPSKSLKRLVEENPDEALDILLHHNFWPATLKGGVEYSRRSDDSDGFDDRIGVFVGNVGSMMGDVFINVFSRVQPDGNLNFEHRFRMRETGGGMSPLVRNALLFLARAIQLDNEERPVG